jgi:hypothetical protein
MQIESKGSEKLEHGLKRIVVDGVEYDSGLDVETENQLNDFPDI